MQMQTTNFSSANTTEPIGILPSLSKKPVVVVELNRVNLKSFIENLNGKFISATFRKLDGSRRKLTGRLGVTSYLRGGVNKVESPSRPYLTMFDIQLLQYRTVSLDTVSEIRACNKTYKVIG